MTFSYLITNLLFVICYTKRLEIHFCSHSQPFYVGRTAVGCGQNETVVDDTPSTREDRKLGAILVGTN